MSHERLAINGVDSGAQPLFNETKNLVLAVNGEIYNHLDIKKELVNPSKFMTESDCEIISHLYEANPENPAAIADRLNGIFAFVLYDEAKDRYIVARDHCGIIPLYWGRDKDGNRWIASELKALHDMCDELSDFPPGHVYDSATDTLTKWYDPAWHDDTVLPTKAVVIEELRTQLVASVHTHIHTRTRTHAHMHTCALAHILTYSHT
jgi:asparagine synthase (glutamine-hydrolysing)